VRMFHNHYWPWSGRARRDRTSDLGREIPIQIIRDDEEEEEPKIEESTSSLLIEGVDTHTDENRKQHHTDEYENQELFVVRRGDSVKISVRCNRAKREKEEIWMRLAHGKIPKLSQGTLVEVTAEKKREVDGEWWLQAAKSGGNKIEYLLHIPANAPVARYHFSVESWAIEDGKYVKKSSWPKPEQPKFTFVILFNPWCPKDQVYMANDEDREEYVNNDHGRVWVGSPQSSRPWYFAQFEDECYEVALDLLNHVGYFENRGDATLICRNFSHLVASHLLQGRWYTPYAPHPSPTDWTGSQRILRYFQTRKDIVKYGQCWVFSAVSTTLCRALGIPCRSVTNFQSAHDTDRSVTIDYHFDKDGKPLEDYNSDSVWNFHVWNEAWMLRNDLPEGYGGWQVFDATPQETSEIGGLMACGPCPVKAIKQGSLHIPYDGKFIFSEVNGDKCYWMQNYRGKFELRKVEHSGIGTAIITKAVGRGNRAGVDLKSDYKEPDGSAMEEKVLHRAYGHSSRRQQILAATVAKKEELVFRFEVDPAETAKAGTTIYATLTVQNPTSKDYSLNVRMSVGAFYYYGRPMTNSNKTYRGQADLKPGEVKTIKLGLGPDDYLDFVKEDAQLRFYCVAESSDGNGAASFVESKQINLDLPEVAIKPLQDTRVGVGSPFRMELSFTNPLKQILTDVAFTVEGAGMRQRTIKEGKDLNPGETMVVKVETFPRRKGTRDVIAAFVSEELSSNPDAITINVI